MDWGQICSTISCIKYFLFNRDNDSVALGTDQRMIVNNCGNADGGNHCMLIGGDFVVEGGVVENHCGLDLETYTILLNV